jgi:SAM-dependent methyltransferase
MNRTTLLGIVLLWCPLASAQQGTTPPQGQQAAPAPAGARTITEKLRSDADVLTPIVSADLARQFLAATSMLTEPSPRVVYRNREKEIAVSKRVYDAMSAEEKATLTPRECTPEFYYETGYGSPLVYARVLDLAAPHLSRGSKPRLLDYGYGTIGQLQLLAHCGFDAHGVDVEPLFEALYSEPGDTGVMGGGSVSIHTGQWPAEETLRKSVGDGFTLITSKNTLKNGYIHPSPPAGQTVDPKRLVHLGVSDEEFVKQVYDALRPGGAFVIYNICPPQNPPDKEYIPWADGTTPFPREMFEKQGFEVIAFDALDQDWVINCFEKLGYAEGKSRDELRQSYFCWYTIVRRRP